MAKISLEDMTPCDDPDCAFCGDDDYEAAFWDEFFYRSESAESDQEKGDKLTLKVVDEGAGEQAIYEDLRVSKSVRKIKGD